MQSNGFGVVLSRGNEVIVDTRDKDKKLMPIMKRREEMTDEERKLVESGSLFYGEDTRELMPIMKRREEMTDEERELVESGSLFYGEDTRELMPVMKRREEMTDEERKLVESGSLFYGEDTRNSKCYLYDNTKDMNKESSANIIKADYNNKFKHLLSSHRSPTINIEAVKQYLFMYYKFIYCNEIRCYDSEKGYYKSLTYHDTIVKINAIIPEEIRGYLKVKDLKDIYKSIKYDHKIQFIENKKYSDNYINCLNGVLNIYNIKNNIQPYVESHNPNHYFLNYVNANYNNNYSIEKTYFYEFIYTVTNGDETLIRLIKQVIGYSLSGFNNAKKAFILYGKSNSGKSVFLNLISALCGEENISNVELQNLSIEKYTAELFGKLINICSELPDREIKDTGIFKALVSETDKVPARKVYGQPFSFYNKAKLIFATNNLPEVKGESYKDNSAFFNRLIIIPFMISIPEEKQDKDLLIKLIEEKDIIFSWAIEGLVEYINNGYIFDEPYISKYICDNYRNNDNSISAFINIKCEICSNSYIHMDRLFKAYIKFCEDLCYDIPSNKDKKRFKSLLEEKYNLTYRKLNRPDGNKYGFDGLKLKNDI